MLELVDIPKVSQISSYFAANKRRKFDPVANVTMGALMKATALMQILPENIDDGSVLDSTFDASNGSFVIVFSTIRLSLHIIGDIIHTNATYKCTWNNYPVIMMGYSDKNRKFHPIILTVENFALFLRLGGKSTSYVGCFRGIL